VADDKDDHDGVFIVDLVDHSVLTATGGVLAVEPSTKCPAHPPRRVCRHWTARMVFEQADRSEAYQQYTDTGSGTYWCTSVASQDQGATHVGHPFPGRPARV